MKIKYEIGHGGVRYVSFVVLNLLCLFAANLFAAWIYLDRSIEGYGFENYRPIMLIMVIVDVGVTLGFNSLERVYRRRKRKELLKNFQHIGISFVALAVILFSLRRGAEYSRVTVYLAYGIDFVLITGTHLFWREILKFFRKKPEHPTALLVTTDRFVEEGIAELKKIDIDVKDIYLLKNLKKKTIWGLPVLRTWEETASVICWDWIDKVYIYGLDHQMVPEYLINACWEMGIKFELVDFNYRVIDIKTIQNEDPQYGALSFLEGKRDIPFPIRRVYWITETEAEQHRGFHAHKLNCQLLYCPYGKIDIILDDGEKKTTVTLDKPGKGLILMPGLWREMVWRESGSVLCVLASEYYDAQEYIRNYDEFIAYSMKYRKVANAYRADKKLEKRGAII